MRPSILNPLFTDVSTLKGVGPAARAGLRRLLKIRFSGLKTPEGAGAAEENPLLRDLLFHLPVSFVDRRFMPPLASAPEQSIISAIVKVESHHAAEGKKARFSKKPYRVTCSNATGSLDLVFFNPRPDYIMGALPVGAQRFISGRVERFDYRLQMTHPDIIAPVDMKDSVAVLEPVYPLTWGMTSRQLVKYMQQALMLVKPLPEWADAALLAQKGWQPWRESLCALHQLKSEKDIGPLSPARARMAHDELLAGQLALALVRKTIRKQSAPILRGNGIMCKKLLETLPYNLTNGQQMVIAEIDADLASGSRMLRLLQGDVGSGKTVVALFAMLKAAEEGKQVALMVPTEILGRQHLAFITGLAEQVGLRVAMLTGSVKGRARAEILAGVEAGLIDIVIGTQALFQDKVVFKDLALVVIDEQHRFGVSQRMALSQKGAHPHVLLMTATPIPRSLTMTAFGDMECSTLAEKPAGRKPIDTRVIPLTRTDEVIEGIGRAVAAGEKVYWICPLIEEASIEEENDDTEKLDLAAAEMRYREFKKRFGERVGMVHGRMKGEEREPVMQGFAGDAYDILVATTVVEVGVNVPDATIMVIEHAERFGLSQLHQLRGRVGRSDKPSRCMLLYDDKKSGEVARSRLRTIRESEDGFFIAEQDLKLRGSGDILGTKQSGLPEFHFADLALHSDLIRTARDDVKLILARDPLLASERGQALRILLYLYGYDEGVHYIHAG